MARSVPGRPQNSGLYAYERYTETHRVLCVLHTGADSIDMLLPLPDALSGKQELTDLYTGKTLPVSQGSVSIRLAAFEGMILE